MITIYKRFPKEYSGIKYIQNGEVKFQNLNYDGSEDIEIIYHHSEYQLICQVFQEIYS